MPQLVSFSQTEIKRGKWYTVHSLYDAALRPAELSKVRDNTKRNIVARVLSRTFVMWLSVSTISLGQGEVRFCSKLFATRYISEKEKRSHVTTLGATRWSNEIRNFEASKWSHEKYKRLCFDNGYVRHDTCGSRTTCQVNFLYWNMEKLFCYHFLLTIFINNVILTITIR